MAAPVLSVFEQKAALSARKKKKKTLKNVLGIPDSLKVRCPVVDKTEAAILHEILNRLLPSAKLPFQRKTKSSKDCTEENVEDLNLREKAKNIRDQLSLGVNILNKSIKKNLVSAVLLADDIQPKFLINHLNLLCDHYKIPFLHMPGLRQVTTASLGFPCIAIGFKTNSCDFQEAITEIKSLFQNCKVTLEKKNEESDTDSSESEVESAETKKQIETDEPPFTYLVRSSVKERAFVPMSGGCDLSKQKTGSDFIPVENDNEGSFKINNSQSGISSNIIRKQAVFENESEAPKKKKMKKEQNSEKLSKKGNSKYCPPELLKIPSNPNRNKKKKK